MKEQPEEVEEPTQTKAYAEGLKKSIQDFSDKVEGFVYPLIIPPLDSIGEDILFQIYPDLRKIGKQEKLHILLYSYGGDAHTAFHIGRLLQAYAKEELLIYILREAKSAATLISCAADKIIFSEISELGPMDPQIRDAKSGQRFSPLAIKHIIDLLQKEAKMGHREIVDALISKLPDPLILGEYQKSLETGKDYLFKLLSSRMLKSVSADKIKDISNDLVTKYPDHSYCIDYTEAKALGLKVEKISSPLDDLIFSIMENYKNVWDEFDLHYKRKDKNELSVATQVYIELKQLASDVIDYQILKKEVKGIESVASEQAILQPEPVVPEVVKIL